ncbi:hypothetical protein PoB_003902900 [Plakobranchus ocellatus]|uniref:G-protein coupled receptors family 1 profile domain-containing protein n=1 Tax=Plakobranchus ocellatus TaxID=259542 RepID=A0AAV4B2C7_9GAST|nr:hypothetical protein PoB_003902900 [Plakobranchus ocellatus]
MLNEAETAAQTRTKTHLNCHFSLFSCGCAYAEAVEPNAGTTQSIAFAAGCHTEIFYYLYLLTYLSSKLVVIIFIIMIITDIAIAILIITIGMTSYDCYPHTDIIIIIISFTTTTIMITIITGIILITTTIIIMS